MSERWIVKNCKYNYVDENGDMISKFDPNKKKLKIKINGGILKKTFELSHLDLSWLKKLDFNRVCSNGSGS